MKKMHLEVVISLASVAVFIILLAGVKLAGASGFGYVLALLIYILMMGMAGLKLAEIPDK